MIIEQEQLEDDRPTKKQKLDGEALPVRDEVLGTSEDTHVDRTKDDQQKEHCGGSVKSAEMDIETSTSQNELAQSKESNESEEDMTPHQDPQCDVSNDQKQATDDWMSTQSEEQPCGLTIDEDGHSDPIRDADIAPRKECMGEQPDLNQADESTSSSMHNEAESLDVSTVGHGLDEPVGSDEAKMDSTQGESVGAPEQVLESIPTCDEAIPTGDTLEGQKETVGMVEDQSEEPQTPAASATAELQEVSGDQGAEAAQNGQGASLASLASLLPEGLLIPETAGIFADFLNKMAASPVPTDGAGSNKALNHTWSRSSIHFKLTIFSPNSHYPLPW